MSLSRREFLRLSGLVSAAAGLAACAPAYNLLAGQASLPEAWLPLPPESWPGLRRLTYGPRLEERTEAAETGLAAWIETQLAPQAIEDPDASWRLRRFDSLSLDADALASREKEVLIGELQTATLIRQVYSRRQLYEMMVEFWSDHFNISVHKGDCWFLKPVDDRQVIRKHALGNFQDLLWASAHSPAMLVYLDNQANLRQAPNENYARELLELHTLGVDGGYAQKDVMEMARCLTGWGVKEHFWRGEFIFEPDHHDLGTKVVLGMTIPPGGPREAESVLERLATHPATAHHLATKLARRFLGDGHPEAELIARASQAFVTTGGDIPALLRVILLDGLVPQADRLPPKFKRPADFITSALRTMNAETDGGGPLLTTLTELGQAPYEWSTPDGPPDMASAWQGNLLPRWRFALALARNELAGTQIDLTSLLPDPEMPASLDRLARLTLGSPLPPAAQQAILAGLNGRGNPTPEPEELAQVVLAGLVASPAFQWR